MKSTHARICAWLLLLLLACAACGKDEAPQQRGIPQRAPAPVEVKLCDNHTTTTVAGDAPKTRELGQKIADTLMAKWKEKNPEADWEAEERKSRTFLPAADNSALLTANTQAPGHPYRNFTQHDLDEWKRETETLVVAGSKVFHSGDELGSTIAVSCDMCHPNAANTHPETYPKFQTQLGRVALLRDMINWCLEHPVRAPKMDADDPRMRAMEAYIVSQRTGTTLSYGKH
jgi:thiosulfate dehydrogenase